MVELFWKREKVEFQFILHYPQSINKLHWSERLMVGADGVSIRAGAWISIFYLQLS